MMQKPDNGSDLVYLLYVVLHMAKAWIDAVALPRTLHAFILDLCIVYTFLGSYTGLKFVCMRCRFRFYLVFQLSCCTTYICRLQWLKHGGWWWSFELLIFILSSLYRWMDEIYCWGLLFIVGWELKAICSARNLLEMYSLVGSLNPLKRCKFFNLKCSDQINDL